MYFFSTNYYRKSQLEGVKQNKKIWNGNAWVVQAAVLINDDGSQSVEFDRLKKVSLIKIEKLIFPLYSRAVFQSQTRIQKQIHYSRSETHKFFRYRFCSNENIVDQTANLFFISMGPHFHPKRRILDALGGLMKTVR